MGAATRLDTLFDRAFAHHCRGDFLRAARAYQELLRFAPAHSSALKAYGVLLFSTGNVEEGLDTLRRATEADPRDGEAWSNYGNALRAVERHPESAEACARAVRLNPSDGTAHSNLSAALRCLGRLSESLHHAERAVAHAPHLPESHLNLASGFQSLGETDIALGALAVAAQANPSHLATRQNLLFTSLYSDQLSDEEVTGMHRDLGDQMGCHLRPAKRSRCLRVGFVSGDFRKHPVGRFFASLLPRLDQGRHKVTLYANQHDTDSVSERLSAGCDQWRPVYGLDDAAVADLVRSDEIDVLVDLSGHSALNRMTLFAMRPCAVQATWLGYSSTTGIPSMDWFLGDQVTNPASHDHLCTERVGRFAETFLCDSPVSDIPDAIPHEGVVFASFNNTSKMSPSCLGLWAEVLKAVPNSKLVLKYATLVDPSVQDHFASRFEAVGVRRDRLVFVGHQSPDEHREFFRTVDLCLDTSPYTGATTTMDALRGGAPVLTLAGGRYSSRMSASILTATGLPDLVTHQPEEFVREAVSLAEDTDGLRSLRQRVADLAPVSPAFDPPRFAASLHDVLDEVWWST